MAYKLAIRKVIDWHLDKCGKKGVFIMEISIGKWYYYNPDDFFEGM